MPEIVCTTVYQFPELSDAAKEKARSWYRELGAHDDWWDAVYDEAPDGEIADGSEYEWGMLPNLFLFSRSDTIYGGTNQIQRNLIAERGLGLPREPRGEL